MWPPRVIVSDARRPDVPVLTVDINRSAAYHRTEQTSRAGVGGAAVAALGEGISEDQVARIAAGRPYNSLQDFWQRARPALPIAEHLIQIGSLDPLRGPSPAATSSSRPPNSTPTPAPVPPTGSSPSAANSSPPNRPGCRR